MNLLQSIFPCMIVFFSFWWRVWLNCYEIISFFIYIKKKLNNNKEIARFQWHFITNSNNFIEVECDWLIDCPADLLKDNYNYFLNKFYKFKVLKFSRTTTYLHILPKIIALAPNWILFLEGDRSHGVCQTPIDLLHVDLDFPHPSVIQRSCLIQFAD